MIFPLNPHIQDFSPLPVLYKNKEALCMACMLVLYVTIPFMCLAVSAFPLLAYFSVSHRVRRSIEHPYLESVAVALFCWAAFGAYLIGSSSGVEMFAATGITIAAFFGFSFSGGIVAFFYQRKKNRFFLFPGRLA